MGRPNGTERPSSARDRAWRPASRTEPDGHVRQFMSRSDNALDDERKHRRPHRNPLTFVYAPGHYFDLESITRPKRPEPRAVDEELTEEPVAPGAQYPLVVQVSSNYLTIRDNAAYANRNLWGTDIYTADSDMVCILHHQGYVVLQHRRVPDKANETVVGGSELAHGRDASNLSARFVNRQVPIATLQVDLVLTKHDGTAAFEASERNNLRSRAWSANYPDGYCLEIKSVVRLGPDGQFLGFVRKPTEHLPAVLSMASATDKEAAQPDPGFAGDLSLTFSRSGEPMLRYSLSAVADAGWEEAGWLSKRLEWDDMVFEDDGGQRYELSRDTDSGYRWSRVRNPLLVEFSKRTKDLVDNNRETINVVKWDQLVWGRDGLTVQDERFPFSKVAYVQRV